MSLRSMTGFGKGSIPFREGRIEVEIGSVNRKQFDARVMLPRGMLSLEARVTKLIAGHVSRGQVSGSIKIRSHSGTDAVRGEPDVAQTRKCIRRIRQIASELGLKDDLTARSLVGLKDWLQPDSPEESSERVWPAVKKALESALGDLLAMRTREGKALSRDLRAHFETLARTLKSIQTRIPGAQKRYKDQLWKRIRASGVAFSKSDPSLARELVMFADRSDVSEEIVRLRSHFVQAGELLSEERDGPVGRELDFLCQEMFREINTTGNKANDSAISRRVVEFKAVLERIREQVQNIE